MAIRPMPEETTVLRESLQLVKMSHNELAFRLRSQKGIKVTEQTIRAWSDYRDGREPSVSVWFAICELINEEAERMGMEYRLETIPFVVRRDGSGGGGSSNFSDAQMAA